MFTKLIALFLIALQVPIPTPLPSPSPVNPTPITPTVVVQNMSALRALGPVARSITLSGYYTPNDGGGGAFTWNPTSTQSDDCGTIIQPNASTGSAGRWTRSLSGNTNLKWWGAIGDGGNHTLAQAISTGEIPSLSTVQNLVPAAQLNWDSDVVAVELAKVKTPTGATVNIPPGTYICSFQSWDMGGRSNITWNGSGPTTKFYATWDTTRMGLLNIGMLFAPYDMSGWKMSASQVFPQTDAKVVGTNTLTIKPGVNTSGLRVGAVVVWQDGRSNFQQNFCEFNQITSIHSPTKSGTLITFRYPWYRDYTSPVAEYGGIITGGPYVAPPVGNTVTMSVDFADHSNQNPGVGDALSIGNDVYTFMGSGTVSGTYVFQNAGQGNTMTSIPSGEKISGVCALFNATEATTDITMSNMTIIGCWDAIQIANIINLNFNNVSIVMQRMADTPAGGLFFDGDGGRNINFNNCTFTAPTSFGSQWGRSTSGVNYNTCTFNNVGMNFSEYAANSSMNKCTMTVDGSTLFAPSSAIDIGETCGGINVSNCTINASNMTQGLIGTTDIQNFAYYHGPAITITNNSIKATDCDSIFAGTYGFAWRPITISGNTIGGIFGSLGKIGQTPDPLRPELTSYLVTCTKNQISGYFDFVLLAAASCDYLDFENNDIVCLGAYQGGNWGGTIANCQGPGIFPAKQQLTIANNTFYNWVYNPNIYQMFNFNNPWTSGMNVSNSFINATGGPYLDFTLTLSKTVNGNFTISSLASGTPTLKNKKVK